MAVTAASWAGLDLPGDVLVAEAPEQGDGLGGAEGQVEPGDLPGRMAGDPLTGHRVVAVEDPAERLPGDLQAGLELQAVEAGAHPAAGGFAVAVVVVDLGPGDRVEVVVGRAAAHAADVQHGRTPRAGAMRG